MAELSHPFELKIFEFLRHLSVRKKLELISGIESFSRNKGFLHRIHSKAEATAHPIALTPFIIPETVVLQCQRLARAVYNFQIKLPGLYRNNAAGIRRILPLSNRSKYWLDIYKGLADSNKNLLLRLDTTLVRDQKTKSLYPVLFENNSTALAGLYNHTIGADILDHFVLSKISFKENKVVSAPSLLNFLNKWLEKSSGPDNRGLAFLEDFPIEKDFGEIPRIAEYFQRRGFEVAHCHPKDLKFIGKEVVLNGVAIDLIYRDLAYKNIPTGNYGAGLKTMIKKDKVIPGFSAEFGHKGILECLTSWEYRRFFTEKELAIFKKSVPWTRVIYRRKTESAVPASRQEKRVDLISYIRENKKDLVIKPNLDAGGAGVVFGKDANDRCWDGMIKRALEEKGEWVVQKAIESPTKKMAYLKDGRLYFDDCYFTFGIFYFNNQVGLHCRISPFKVANVGRGGALACVFIDKGK